MKKLNVWSAAALVLLPALLASGPAQGVVVFTTNSAVWIATHPGAAHEGFENANIASGTATAFTGPLNASTNNSIFATGSVIPGFSLSAVPPGSADIYVDRDFGGNTGATVSSNFFGANIDIAFATTVTAIGIDLMQWQGNNGGWTVEVYDSANVLLGSFSTLAGSFVGIDSTDAIARLFIDKPDIGGVIDNLRFGTVPEPATLLLIALGLLGFGLRRQRAA